MLYKKNTANSLADSLFQNPTSEYRGAPFWAWNCELDKETLQRQIEYLKEMGFGGFHMHSRTGMATEYLSEEFMDLVKACVDKAEQERFSLQRQRNALQTQLRHAVEAEDFESAARLRDQLKALPQQ